MTHITVSPLTKFLRIAGKYKILVKNLREMRKYTLKKIENKAKKLSKKLRHIPNEEIVKLIREDREER